MTTEMFGRNPGEGISVMQRRCANCDNWDSRDSQVGFCMEITEYMRLDDRVMVQGLATCRTAATGECLFFEISPEAQQEAMAEAQHVAELRVEAGRSYPASLNR
jgi:hypothetical protein